MRSSFLHFAARGVYLFASLKKRRRNAIAPRSHEIAIDNFSLRTNTRWIIIVLKLKKSYFYNFSKWFKISENKKRFDYSFNLQNLRLKKFWLVCNRIFGFCEGENKFWYSSLLWQCNSVHFLKNRTIFAEELKVSLYSRQTRSTLKVCEYFARH